MSLLRNTDVKKHLGRAVPRLSSVHPQDKDLPKDAADGEAPIVTVPLTDDVPEKVETV